MNKYFEKMIRDFSFEKREEQEKMANLVKEHIQNNVSCLIEAGTGIGKSLAYLLPSVLYALENNERIVISTNTINLQEQLIEKDLPLLEKILGVEIKYTLVKGRSNYVCGNRLMKNCTDENLINWYKKTKTGDKSEIDFYVSVDQWDLVKSDADYCKNSRCISANECFYYKAKKNLQNYNIYIVNHSLLFSHFTYDILPKFNYIILDEAHNIENIARSYFEKNVDSNEIFSVIGILNNNKNNKGVATKIIEELGEKSNSKLLIDVIESINSLYLSLANMFAELKLNVDSTNNLSFRLLDLKNTKQFEENRKKAIEKFNLFDNYANRIIDIAKEQYVEENIYQDFLMYYAKLKSYMSIIENLYKYKDSNVIEWVKVSTSSVSINITPLDISKDFSQLIKDFTVIMCSATLTVNNNFEYIKSRLGIESYKEYYINSPFNYDENMLISISKNKYDPNSVEYINYVIDFINTYIKNKNEGTFILCTSYKQVELISHKLILDDFNILVQGSMSRNALINNFKNNEKSILIGTDSFWEGIDVKGEKLKNVVIVKLPFQVPNEPVTKAIIDDISKKGEIAFLKYQLPMSIIKLKQGVGRLIRSKEDKGEIIILDNRVKYKNYGKTILQSLPSKNIKEI